MPLGRFTQLDFVGGIYLNKYDAAAIALMAATPYEAISRVLPLIYTQEAIESCAVNGSNGKVRLSEAGLIGITGECYINLKSKLLA